MLSANACSISVVNLEVFSSCMCSLCNVGSVAHPILCCAHFYFQAFAETHIKVFSSLNFQFFFLALRIEHIEIYITFSSDLTV